MGSFILIANTITTVIMIVMANHTNPKSIVEMTSLVMKAQRNMANIQVTTVKSLMKQNVIQLHVLFPWNIVKTGRKRYAKWNNGLSLSKLRSMSIPNIADQFQKLFVIMLIKCISPLAVCRHRGKNAVSIQRKNVKIYQKSI